MLFSVFLNSTLTLNVLQIAKCPSSRHFMFIYNACFVDWLLQHSRFGKQLYRSWYSVIVRMRVVLNRTFGLTDVSTTCAEVIFCLSTLKMTFAQVVETSVNNNSSFQIYSRPDDHTIRANDTPGFNHLLYNCTEVLNHFMYFLLH